MRDDGTQYVQLYFFPYHNHNKTVICTANVIYMCFTVSPFNVNCVKKKKPRAKLVRDRAWFVRLYGEIIPETERGDWVSVDCGTI